MASRGSAATDALRSARLTVDGEADAEARYLSAINDVLLTTFLQRPFRARLDAWRLGPLHLVALTAGARRSERTPALFARDRHDGVSFQYVASGRATGVAGDRALVSLPGTVMVLDFAQPFTVTDHEDRRVINVSVPRALVRDMVDDAADLHGQILGVRGGALLGGLLEALTPQLPDTPAADGPRLGQVVLDLIALALGGTRGQGAEASRAERLRGRALGLMDGRLGSDQLSPEWLADKLSVSRSDLYAAFQDQGGVAKAIWRRRLEAARTALASPLERRRIGEIAFALGFSSEAHFSRAFKATFGLTAGEARRSGSEQSQMVSDTGRTDGQ